jgi:hypothetical protein
MGVTQRILFSRDLQKFQVALELLKNIPEYTKDTKLNQN